MISPDIMTIPAAGQDFYGKTAGKMISDCFVDKSGNVTGTFHYVSGYTGFNSEKTEEQEGYYFPFVLTKNGTNMTFKKNGVEIKKEIPVEKSNVFRITSGDVFEVMVDGKSVVVFSFASAKFDDKAVKNQKTKRTSNKR